MDILTLYGLIIGYTYFLLNLESNILYNRNSFTCRNITKYMMSPFYQIVLWYPSQINQNWIFTTFIGGMIGYMLNTIIETES